MRRTHHLWRHLNRPTSSKPIFSYNNLYNLQALWESSMETYIHSRKYKLRGSPAWKHTFTQEGIQALWESSINTIGYTSSVGVQHGNTHSHWIYKRPWESSMETHIHTREYTHRRRFGPDLGEGSRLRIIIGLLKSVKFRRVTIQCF